MAIKNGSLSGLMLTGLSPQGVDLLENYLNRTGDVQTVSNLATDVLFVGIPLNQVYLGLLGNVSCCTSNFQGSTCRSLDRMLSKSA